MNEFLAMGGYARYLWPSYGLFVALLAWMAVSGWMHHRKALGQLQSASSHEGATQ